MRFKETLSQAKLIKRYKRFLADVVLSNGETTTVHVPNSGSMASVSDPGSRVYISTSDNPNRKLKYTLEIVETLEGSAVGTNTARTNSLVKEAFEKKTIPHWNHFETIQSEVKINSKSRIDFLLTGKNRKRYVEVKNVSMARPPLAVFPDAVTERGQKHLIELVELMKKGFESEIFFVVQREDCKAFSPCDDIDAEYGRLLRWAVKQGVIISCWSCKVSPNEITLIKPLQIKL